MHKVYNLHRAAIQRVVPKKPHKRSSQLLGRRRLPCRRFRAVITKHGKVMFSCVDCGVMHNEHKYYLSNY